MGLIGLVLSHTYEMRTDAAVADVKIDVGGAGYNVTAQHFATSGDDSVPLEGDYAVTVGTPGAGTQTCVGFVDPLNQQIAQAGDRRVYSRDPQTGEQVAQVWIKNTGEIVVQNDTATTTYAADGRVRTENPSGFYELRAGGTVDINTVLISPTGDVTLPAGATLTSPTVVAQNSLTISGKELKDHDHDYNNPEHPNPVLPITQTGGNN